MKFKKDFVGNFSKIVLSISVFMLCASAFVFSIHKVTANDSKAFNFPEKLTEVDRLAIQNSNGKYQMEISTGTSEGDLIWFILVWDTQTGRSKLYFGDPDSANGTRGAYSKFQLPSKPL